MNNHNRNLGGNTTLTNDQINTEEVREYGNAVS